MQVAPGGLFLFNAWDKIEDNDFADVVTAALAGIFPQDPPRFMARTPHGYHAVRQIEKLRAMDPELDSDIRLLTRQLES